MKNKISAKLFALVFWQSRWGDLVNKLYDYKLFRKYSFNKDSLKHQGQYAYYLTKKYHIIEKALGLPQPRPEFGKNVVNELIKIGNEYMEKFGYDSLINSIASTLDDYLTFNRNQGVNINNAYYKKIKGFVDENLRLDKNGGAKTILLNDLNKAINFDYTKFVETRSSVRDFSAQEVTETEIQKIFETARLTPSVCNRQGWKAHVYFKKEIIKDLLTLQNGNRGFADSINKLIIVTGDMRAFTTLESNQIYTDGGLFAMNILLSIHHNGLGGIALNTCLPYLTEKKIIKIADLKEYEKLIMMIGVGHLKDNFRVAVSNKKEISQILQIHN